MSIICDFCKILLRTAIIPSPNPSVTVQIQNVEKRQIVIWKAAKILSKMMLVIPVVVPLVMAASLGNRKKGSGYATAAVYWVISATRKRAFFEKTRQDV